MKKSNSTIWNAMLKHCDHFSMDLDNDIMNHMLSNFFNQMNSVKDSLQQNEWEKMDIQINKVNVEYLMPKTDLKTSFPSNFKQIIHETIQYQVIYQTQLFGKKINIYIFSEKKDSIKDVFNQVCLMLMWLSYVLSLVKTNCSNTLTIYFYKMKMKKQLPSDRNSHLHDYHVNSAFTYCCAPTNEIVLFREEEWFKVFIHETFHSLGLDFSRLHYHDKHINDTLKDLFGINISYDLAESYCETWGRLINVIFCSYWSNHNYLHYAHFKKDFYQNMKIEVMFSIIQMLKILNHNKLDYDHLIIKETKDSIQKYYKDNYKEFTPVFSYYVLTSINLININEFIKWCSTHNKIIFAFDQNSVNLYKYVLFIKKTMKNDRIYKQIACVENMMSSKSSHDDSNNGNKHNKELIKSLRMSINEMEFI